MLPNTNFIINSKNLVLGCIYTNIYAVFKIKTIKLEY